MRRSCVQTSTYSGVSVRPFVCTFWCTSASTRSAPVRAIFSRSEPSDCRTHCSCARYWSKPLTRMPSAVSSRKLAPRRQPRRRQNGSRALRCCASVVSISGLSAPLDRQLGHVPLEEQLDRPVEDHAETGRPGGELQHVHGLPHEPGGKANQLESAQVGHRLVPAERHHFTQQLEVERFPRTSGQRGLY